MKTDTPSRSEIIASLASLPHALQGKICDDPRVLADGRTVTYHNLQFWADGRNHTIRIPEEKLAEFKEAVANGRKAKALLADLTRADAREMLSSAPALKKKSPKSRSGARQKSAR